MMTPALLSLPCPLLPPSFWLCKFYSVPKGERWTQWPNKITTKNLRLLFTLKPESNTVGTPNKAIFASFDLKSENVQMRQCLILVSSGPKNSEIRLKLHQFASKNVSRVSSEYKNDIMSNKHLFFISELLDFNSKKFNFWLKLALFDLKLKNWQIRQWVALFKNLPYLTLFLRNFTLPYLE